MRYYNIATRLKNNPYHLQYFFCVSGRGPGKSYSMAKFLNDHFVRTGKKFIRIVRNIRFMPDCGSYFNSFPQYNITYDGKYYYKNGIEMGRVIPLTYYASIRSGNFDEYDIILMEEFATIDPFEYLPNETELFKNILSTVFRERAGLVVFIGNNNNRMTNYNPYFELFKIDWDALQLKQGDFKVITPVIGGARVGIERTEMAYETLDEIPLMMRIPHNEIATSGEYEEDNKVIEDVKTVRRKLAMQKQFKVAHKFYITIYDFTDKGYLYIKGSKSELSRVSCADLTLTRNEKQIRQFIAFLDAIKVLMRDKKVVLRYSDVKTHYQFVITQKNYLEVESGIS